MTRPLEDPAKAGKYFTIASPQATGRSALFPASIRFASSLNIGTKTGDAGKSESVKSTFNTPSDPAPQALTSRQAVRSLYVASSSSTNAPLPRTSRVAKPPLNRILPKSAEAESPKIAKGNWLGFNSEINKSRRGLPD